MNVEVFVAVTLIKEVTKEVINAWKVLTQFQVVFVYAECGKEWTSVEGLNCHMGIFTRTMKLFTLSELY